MRLAVLKNLMLFLSYLLFGLTAHAIIRDRPRCHRDPRPDYLSAYQLQAQRDLSHTVALLFAACMFFFFFVRALQRPTVVNYAMAGVSIGIGILSKYNFVLLPLAAAIALLPDRQLRRRLFDWRTLLMVAVAAAIVTPHALWFLDQSARRRPRPSRS